jgi:hypothetical protein
MFRWCPEILGVVLKLGRALQLVKYGENCLLLAMHVAEEQPVNLAALTECQSMQWRGLSLCLLLPKAGIS